VLLHRARRNGRPLPPAMLCGSHAIGCAARNYITPELPRKPARAVLQSGRKGDPRRAARMARLGYLHERREFRPLRNRTFGVEFRGNVGAADQVHVGLCGLEAVVQITTWFLACADDDIVHLQ